MRISVSFLSTNPDRNLSQSETSPSVTKFPQIAPGANFIVTGWSRDSTWSTAAPRWSV
jgi:hypothetical protein